MTMHTTTRVAGRVVAATLIATILLWPAIAIAETNGGTESHPKATQVATPPPGSEIQPPQDPQVKPPDGQGPKGPQLDPGLIPTDLAPPDPGQPSTDTTPGTETTPGAETTPGTESTPTTPGTTTTRTGGATPTAGEEETPAVPPFEQELPFTGGNPYGYWILGGLLAAVGVIALFIRKGALPNAALFWVKTGLGIVLVIGGLATAGYPYLTDLRYIMAQRSMATAGDQGLPEGAVARIAIPKIGLDSFVLQGTTPDVLDRGPGHYPDTPLPGDTGNASIAGHRTMFGHPFRRLDELAQGDEITTFTGKGQTTYRVASVTITDPSDFGVVAPTTDDRLTLTTCNPVGSARERLIVVAMRQ